MSKFKDIKALLKEIIGTDNTLNNNILFIDFTGSHEKAQYLSQLFYWSSRTKIKGGWIAKRHEDWYNEIRIKPHSIRRFSQEFNNKGFLEMKLKKFSGVTMPHYLLDEDELIEQLLTFCKGNKLSTLQIVNPGVTNCQPSQGNKLSTSTNIDYTKTTTKTTNKEDFASKDAPLSVGSKKKSTKSQNPKRKKIAPKKEKTPSLHTKVKNRFEHWQKIHNPESTTIYWDGKEVGQLTQLINRLQDAAKKKKFIWTTDEQFIENVFDVFCKKFIESGQWYADCFVPSSIVSKWNTIIQTLHENGNKKTTGKNNGITEGYKARILATLAGN